MGEGAAQPDNRGQSLDHAGLLDRDAPRVEAEGNQGAPDSFAVIRPRGLDAGARSLGVVPGQGANLAAEALLPIYWKMQVGTQPQC